MVRKGPKRKGASPKGATDFRRLRTWGAGEYAAHCRASGELSWPAVCLGRAFIALRSQGKAEVESSSSRRLATKEETVEFVGTFWALVPPIVAIVLALITKETFSSLFVGIVVGALLLALQSGDIVNN